MLNCLRNIGFLSFAVTFLFATRCVVANERSHDDPVIAHVQSFVDAFNAGDAQAISATFTDDGQLSLAGEVVAEGRDAIKAFYAAAFQDNPAASITVDVRSLQRVGTRIAIESGTSTIKAGDKATIVVEAYTAVHARKGDSWSTVSVEIDQPVAAQPFNWKKELGFLEGTWSASTSGLRQLTSKVEWAAGGAFLKRTFSVSESGEPKHSGIQLIGWDPQTNEVTSWEFTSDGGYGRGWWTRDADHWSIESEGTTADGDVTRSLNRINVITPNTLEWSSTERSLNGIQIDDAVPILVIRDTSN